MSTAISVFAIFAILAGMWYNIVVGSAGVVISVEYPRISDPLWVIEENEWTNR